MTSTSHGPSLLLEEGNPDLPLTAADLKKYNINDDTIIGATYEFEYLGNNKFSDMKMIESETYSDLLKEIN